MAQQLITTMTRRCIIWLVAQVLLVCAAASLAFQVQQDGIAPAVLFPLGVGAMLGAGGMVVSRAVGAPGPRVALTAALVSGLLVVVGQDYIGHRYRLRLYADEVARQGPLAAAAVVHETIEPRFPAYLASRLRSEPLWWGLDAVLTSSAALAVGAWALRRNRIIPSRQA